MHHAMRMYGEVDWKSLSWNKCTFSFGVSSYPILEGCLNHGAYEHHLTTAQRNRKRFTALLNNKLIIADNLLPYNSHLMSILIQLLTFLHGTLTPLLSKSNEWTKFPIFFVPTGPYFYHQIVYLTYFVTN